MTADLSVLSASPACIGGGAERVAYTLHREYLSRGFDSWLAVATRNCDEPRVLKIPVDESRTAWARALLGPAWALVRRPGSIAQHVSRDLRVLAEPARYAAVLAGHEDFEFPATARLLELPPAVPDVLHLHNLHGAWFDIRALPALSARVPTMITMHDAWLLTGHCAYPLDCERWKTGCGDCPYLDLYVPIRRDESASNARIKHEALRASRLALACPSRWLFDMVEETGIIGDRVQARVVHNGIDVRVFKPADKALARAELGIPPDAAVLCVAAKGLAESQFKGFATLRSALELLPEYSHLREDTLLLALGSDSHDSQVGNVAVRFVPFMRDPTRIALHYQASDVYVHPALAENFPLAVLEAMACGIPVIASEVGGIPEIVANGETGLLFRNADVDALTTSISSLLDDAERRAAMGAAGVERVRSDFTLDRQADAYLGWYDELLEEWSA